MREEMTALSKSISRVVLDAALAMPAGILAQPLVTAVTSSTGHPNTGPVVGHRVEKHHREFESLTPLPVKGTSDLKPHLFPQPNPRLRRSLSSSQLDTHGCLFSGTVEGIHDRHTQLGPQYSSSKLPKFNFPVFNGENPKLWITNFEDYFELYSVEPHIWIKAATMNLLVQPQDGCSLWTIVVVSSVGSNSVSWCSVALGKASMKS
jgi:hypothetical protein